MEIAVHRIQNKPFLGQKVSLHHFAICKDCVPKFEKMTFINEVVLPERTN
jgi:hypothetical protein